MVKVQNLPRNECSVTTLKGTNEWTEWIQSRRYQYKFPKGAESAPTISFL